MTLRIRLFGKKRRLRSMWELKHVPSGRGAGKWHSRRSLWKYKRAQRRKRIAAKAARAVTRRRC